MLKKKHAHTHKHTFTWKEEQKARTQTLTTIVEKLKRHLSAAWSRGWGMEGVKEFWRGPKMQTMCFKFAYIWQPSRVRWVCVFKSIYLSVYGWIWVGFEQDAITAKGWGPKAVKSVVAVVDWQYVSIKVAKLKCALNYASKCLQNV